jgi:hypothetical protein
MSVNRLRLEKKKPKSWLEKVELLDKLEGE